MRKKSIFKKIASGALAVAMIAGPFGPSAPVFAEPADDFIPTPNHIFQDHKADAGARLDDILSQMTLDEKVSRSSGNGAINRLNLTGGRGTGGGEALHGVAWSAQATVFPNSLGLSQSWDQDLFNKIGDVIAKEALAISGGVSSPGRLAPVVDLLRDPRYGRAYETLGEDQYLTGSLATAMAHGMNQRTEEGYQRFSPILKHFMAYNAEVNRLWVASSLTPRTTNEYYIKAFKYPVSAGASKSLMNSYPVVNGKPMSVHPLQNDLLFKWTPDYEGTGHYEYTTMNDYGSGSSVFVHSQRYFGDDTLGRALGMAEGAKNGQMPWSFRGYGSDGGMKYEALARGMATEKDYEELARRSLAMQLRFGDMDQLGVQNPYLIQTNYGTRESQMTANRGLALQASQEQIVLLKNDGVLPLKGADAKKAVLLGPLSDQILKDFYSGSYKYRITIKDALENQLGAGNVFFNRAIDTVAIKSVSTGKYLTGGTSANYSASGSAGNAVVQVNGTAKPASVSDTANRNAIFEVYDYGSANWLLRTPINGRYVQVVGAGAAASSQTSAARMMYNNTSAPGEGNINETASGQNLTFSNYQKFRLAPTTDGHVGIYHLLSGDGINGGTPLAYDVDDEDINRGSYIYVNSAERVVPDITNTNGPWQSEYNVTSRIDNVANDGKIDNLPNDSFKFDFESIQSVEEAARQQIEAANDPTAPIILVVGYEPHMNAREAVDLYKTGLSDQQMRLVNYVTKDLAKDVILVVKTGNPMTISREVADNPKVRAILEMGQTGQEEGAAVVSALFDTGYSVPATGWAPATSGQFTVNTGAGAGPNQPYTAYPGYLPEGGRTIAAYAPAGRLSATWYDGISQMIGASEAHAPASYVYPDYSETNNDNMSNMNGTINTGLLTYDIIKGERTYQYLNKTPLYPFGFGLTYTTFNYSDVAVSDISANSFKVTGKVTNAGSILSDEVVEVYGKFVGTASRVKQPNQKLIAYDRLKSIAPGETRSFSFEVDITDKLGVWDVESGDYIVEPGAYQIKAAPTSAAAGAYATVTLSGTAAPARNLSKLTLAENFDDYSNVGGMVDDVETVSSSVEVNSNAAMQYRKNGAWMSYKDVVFGEAPAFLTIKAGADRAGKLSVYALPAGTDPAALTGAAPVATFDMTNTRKGVTAVGLGIGPAGRPATPSSAGLFYYPGDLNGQQTKDNYVKPEYKTMTASVSGVSAGSRYDIYLLAENRGGVIEWLKFGKALDTTENVEIYSIYSADSIREAQGELQLSYRLSPASSAQPVAWSVSAQDGGATGLATIDANGLLKATGAGNGYVAVTAASGAASATYDVMVTNQLASNKVLVNNVAKTIDYPIIRTGTAWAGDSISAYGGSLTMGVGSREIFSENAAKWVATGTYLTVPVNAFTWSISDLDGEPTDLATISATGVVTATGKDDGKVLVKATLNNNPDIVDTRVITLTNQGAAKDPFKMIQVKDNNIGSTGMGNQAATFAAGGNEIGFYTQATNGRAGFRNVDFSVSADKFYIRVASTANTTVSVWTDGYNEAGGGKLLGTLAMPSTGSNNIYKTYVLELSKKPLGKHDVYLVFTGTVRANWFQFEKANFAAGQDGLNVQAKGESDIDGEVYAPVFSISVEKPTTARLIVAAYDAKGRLLGLSSGDLLTLGAGEEGTLTTSLDKPDGAVTYKTFIWDEGYTPLTGITSLE